MGVRCGERRDWRIHEGGPMHGADAIGALVGWLVGWFGSLL
jgi:hypothetical protein